jgi:hypothetical protein
MIGPADWCDETPDSYHVGRHEETLGCSSRPICHPEGEPEILKDSTPGYDPPPEHYATGSGVQPWDVVDAFGLDYYTGSALKYICRAGKKDIAPRLDDLIKARNFLSRAIEIEEKKP